MALRSSRMSTSGRGVVSSTTMSRARSNVTGADGDHQRRAGRDAGWSGRPNVAESRIARFGCRGAGVPRTVGVIEPSRKISQVYLGGPAHELLGIPPAAATPGRSVNGWPTNIAIATPSRPTARGRARGDDIGPSRAKLSLNRWSLASSWRRSWLLHITANSATRMGGPKPGEARCPRTPGTLPALKQLEVRSHLASARSCSTFTATGVPSLSVALWTWATGRTRKGSRPNDRYSSPPACRSAPRPCARRRRGVGRHLRLEQRELVAMSFPTTSGAGSTSAELDGIVPSSANAPRNARRQRADVLLADNAMDEGLDRSEHRRCHRREPAPAASPCRRGRRRSR